VPPRHAPADFASCRLPGGGSGGIHVKTHSGVTDRLFKPTRVAPDWLLAKAGSSSTPPGSPCAKKGEAARTKIIGLLAASPDAPTLRRQTPSSAAGHERLRATFAPRFPENTGPPKLSPRKSPPPSQPAATLADSRSQNRWPQLKALHRGRSRSGTDVEPNASATDRHSTTAASAVRHIAIPQHRSAGRNSSFIGKNGRRHRITDSRQQKLRPRNAPQSSARASGNNTPPAGAEARSGGRPNDQRLRATSSAVRRRPLDLPTTARLEQKWGVAVSACKNPPPPTRADRTVLRTTTGGVPAACPGVPAGLCVLSSRSRQRRSRVTDRLARRKVCAPRRGSRCGPGL
jgi:hypothetical protein